jgi:hypothetical protein
VEQKPDVNGCGAKGSFIDPPDFRFEAACDEHDLAYAFGGTPHDRAEADRALLKSTKDRAACAPWYKAAYLYPAAYTYFGFVRVFGWRYWTKGPARSQSDAESMAQAVASMEAGNLERLKG